MAAPIAHTGFFARVRDGFDDFVAASPSRFAATVFAALVLIFTGLLSLPIATSSGQQAPIVDALFTAVSVICVTGLTTVDMGTFWSPFGLVTIFVGVQIGGAGVLTMASILGLVISRRLGLRQKLIAAGDTNLLRVRKGPVAEHQALGLSETGGLLRTVAISMLVIESAIAAILFPRLLLEGMDVFSAAWQSFYWAAMSFTNTGFVPTAEGTAPFATDPWFLIALMLSVVLGAIGFPVIYSLRKHLRSPRLWSIHAKLTLVAFGILFLVGTASYLILEASNPRTFGDLDAAQTVLQTAFMSVMSRSGGFATIDYSTLDGSSLMVTDMLMFVGGGSASTAGGIKVTTIAILFLAALAEARGSDEMESFGRRIPQDVLRLGVAVVLWGATLVSGATVTILFITDGSLDHVLFDVISAFATCGLSTGFTGSTSDPAQIVLAITMFAGRIGTVTLAAALAQRQRRQLFTRPEERPIVG